MSAEPKRYDYCSGGSTNDGQLAERYRALVDNFVEWTGRNHLLLNVAKRPGSLPLPLTLEERGHFLHLKVEVTIK